MLDFDQRKHHHHYYRVKQVGPLGRRLEMKNGILASMFGTAATFLMPAMVWANGASGEGYRHGGYMGGGHMFYGPVMMVLIIGGIVALVVLLTRKRCRHRHGGPGPRGKSPQDILKERYARGEMTTKEFEERRKVLGD
ncbi:MAG: SHOCT domain-containing protein [Rhodospirillales bacterium]|nr:SHOCT domain-containing protein [Rhodospirillales bacterium]